MNEKRQSLAQDWHPEQVKAAVRMAGMTLAALARSNGYERTAFSKVLVYPLPSVQAVIASHIGVRPQDIWPSRYDLAGNPKRQRSNGKRMVNARLRQKSKAA